MVGFYNIQQKTNEKINFLEKFQSTFYTLHLGNFIRQDTPIFSDWQKVILIYSYIKVQSDSALSVNFSRYETLFREDQVISTGSFTIIKITLLFSENLESYENWISLLRILVNFYVENLSMLLFKEG